MNTSPLNIQHLLIQDLIPATYNPRRITDAELEKVKQSVQEFGMVEPLIVNEDMTVIGGHQRLRCAAALGWETVPCLVVSLNKKDERRLNLKLNRLGGQFDEVLLKDLLLEFSEVEMEEIGFSELELENILGTKDLSDMNKEIDPDSLGDEKKTTCPECGHEF